MSKKGFTLIELLVVIAIIGILAVLIIVALGRARQNARNASRKSIINSIALAEEMNQDTENTYTDIAGLVANGYLDANPDGNPDAGTDYTVHAADATSYCVDCTGWEGGATHFHCDEGGCGDGDCI